MSDPMASVEIEDVLSSIRRLVSEDRRGMPPRAARQAVADDENKLVLTPALRVPANDVSNGEETGGGAEQRALLAAIEARLGGEIAHMKDEADHFIFGAAARKAEASVPDAGRLQVEEANGANGAAAPQVDAGSGIAALEKTIAELEAAVSAGGGEWEPDGSEMAPVAESFEDLENTAPAAPAVETVGGDDPAAAGDMQVAVEAEAATNDETVFGDDVPDVPAEDDEPQAEEPGAIWSRRLHLGPAAAPSEPALVYEDDSDEADDLPESDVAPAAAVFARAELSLSAPDGAGPDDAEESLFDEDDPAVIDEAMLRDLVAEIIRQELQGTLGERITRNVRKLVRREIHRVLSSRDFD